MVSPIQLHQIYFNNYFIPAMQPFRTFFNLLNSANYKLNYKLKNINENESKVF